MRLRALLPVIAALLLAAGGGSAAEPFARGLLWEISRPGSATSHLFGTMHTADSRLLDLSPAVEQAFAGARTVVLEMVPDDAVARRFSEAGELSGGRRLSALLDPPAYARLAQRLAARGLDPARVDRFKPWAALLLLTEAPADTGPGDGAAAAPGLDVDFYARARVARKRVEVLDSVEEQIAVFDDLPETTQLALLAVAIDRHDRLVAEHEARIAAYRRGDLGRLMRLSRDFPGATAEQQAHLAVLEKKVVRDRSVVMAHRLQSVLRRGPAFAAVGALHLYGRHGMLQLLRDDGWTVRRRD